MVNDPDAIWKPGYDGPPPIIRPLDDPDGEEPSKAGATPSRSRRFAAGLALVAVLAGAIAVFDPFGLGDGERTDERSARVIEPPDPLVFGGPAARRLPRDAETLWTLEIAHDGEHWVDAVRRDVVVAAIVEPDGSSSDADAADAVTTVIAIDALTGGERWNLYLAARPGDVSVIGAVDDVLVLEQPGVNGPIVVGLDIATGERRWSIASTSSSGHVGLVGTPFIAELASSPDGAVSLIDATSGRRVGAIASDPSAAGRPGGWSTDGRGTWFVSDGGAVDAYDLRVTLGEPTPIAEVDGASRPSLVVAGRLAFVTDSGSIALEGVDPDDPVTVSVEVPRLARSFAPVSDSVFVVEAPRVIVGVAVDDDATNVIWSRRNGVIMDHHPVEGGSLVQVATRGGAAIELVDGLTGATVEHLTMTPGALQALVVAGDGAVVRQSSDAGARLAGLDLDGTERWSIEGSEPVLVADRVVVRVTESDADDENPSVQQLRLTVYGDAD